MMNISSVQVRDNQATGWIVTFQAGTYSYQMTVNKQKSVIQTFWHNHETLNDSCPLCGRSLNQQCPALWEQPEKVKALVSLVLQHPTVRLYVMTETQINVDVPPIEVLLPSYSSMNVNNVRERLAFFQDIAHQQGVSLIGLEDSLMFAVVDGIKRKKRHVQVILQTGKMEFREWALIKGRTQLLDESLFYPFVPLANSKSFQTIEWLRQNRK